MREKALPLIGYLLFFALLFLQFPLKDALPGNCDSWLVIAISHQYRLFFERLLDPTIGFALYPASQVFSYGEASPGCCAIYLFFRFFGLPDLWAYYAYLTAIFALTAWAAYRFALLFMPPFPGALLVGFTFTCSNIFFAHIDDSIVYFYFLPLTVSRLLWEALERGDRRRLIVAALLGGLQIYFSLYVFIYQSLLLAAIVIYRRHRREDGVRRTTCLTPSFGRAAMSGATSIYILTASPFLAFYLWSKLSLGIIDPFGLLYTARMTSLMPFDLIAALPENPIYGELIDLPQNWGFVRHRNFIGLMTVALGFYGLMKWNGRRLLFILIAAFGLLFALGPNLMYHPQAEVLPPAPLYPFYTWVPILSYLRVTNRAYFLVLLALSLCAGLSLDRIFRRLAEKRRGAAYALAIAVFLLHGVENIPPSFKAWPVARYIELPDDYARFAATTAPGEVFLDLPTRFNMRTPNWDPAVFDDPSRFVRLEPGLPRLAVSEMSMFTSSWDPLFQYNRELIYLFWQSQHRRSTVSGLNGYFPTPRMIYQQYAERIPDPAALDWLRRHQVSALVYHKGMELKKDTFDLSQLESSPLLEKVFEGPLTVVFRIR